MLNKEELMGAMSLKTAEVELPEGVVLVSEISAGKYLDMCDLSKLDGEEVGEDGTMQLDMKKFNPAILVYCVVDAEGNRIFDENDMEFLSTKAAQVPFMKLVQRAKELNGLIGDEGNDSEPTETPSSDGE